MFSKLYNYGSANIRVEIGKARSPKGSGTYKCTGTMENTCEVEGEYGAAATASGEEIVISMGSVRIPIWCVLKAAFF